MAWLAGSEVRPSWSAPCICFNKRGLAATDLVDNAELKGATPLMEFAGAGAMTFTY
jgi:hypothetical protein